MVYSSEISRRNPGCIVFLLDQSGSMNDQLPDGNTKATGAADAINRLLQELILKCTKEDGVRNYFDIGIIGYGSSEGFAGPIVGQGFTELSSLAAHPLRIESRLKKEPDGAGGIIESNVKFPIWFEPVSAADTPMCQALGMCNNWIEDWTKNHSNAFPPIVFNITDGEATDGDPESIANNIKNVSTSDGNTLLFNCHISGTGGTAILFPSSESELPSDPLARKLFRMSSTLPEAILQLAQKESFTVSETSRGFAFNADLVHLIRFLDIGTQVSREQLR